MISMSLYGNDPKYIQGAISNARLKDTYFPGWALRFYVSRSIPTDVVQKLKDLGAEIRHPPESLMDDKFGTFWRFLPADENTVDRFISRDCDSRLNARDRFAVEEWIESERMCHVLRDHPNHYLPMLAGLWGCNNRLLREKNTSMNHLLEHFFNSEPKCNNGNMEWGCDQTFLNDVIWPLIEEMGQIGHDSFFCTRRRNSVGFPTPRDTNDQFVGQVFNADDTPRQRDFAKSRAASTAQECKSTNNQDFLPSFYDEVGTSHHRLIENSFTLTMPQWLHSDSNVSIVMKFARVDRMGEQTRAFILLSAFADCHGYNFCVAHNSGQNYAFEFSVPICPPNFPSEGIPIYQLGKDPIAGPGIYEFWRDWKFFDNHLLKFSGAEKCLYNDAFRRYWRERILAAPKRGAFKNSQLANEDLFPEKDTNTIIIAVHVRRGDITNTHRRDIFIPDMIVIEAISRIRTLLQAQGKFPLVHLFSENYGTTNWTAYKNVVDFWHLAPQMNSNNTIGHKMDWELNLRDWVHFLKADVMVTSGSFSETPGFLREDPDLSSGIPLTFKYCVIGAKRDYYHYLCNSFPYHNVSRIAYKMHGWHLSTFDMEMQRIPLSLYGLEIRH